MAIIAGYIAALLILSYVVWGVIERPCRTWLLRLGPGKPHGHGHGKAADNLFDPGKRYLIGATAALASLALAFYLVTSNPHIVPPARAKEIAAQSLPAGPVKFGTYGSLTGYYFKKRPDGLELHLIWQADKRRDPDALVLALVFGADDKSVITQTGYVTGVKPSGPDLYVDEPVVFDRLKAEARQVEFLIHYPDKYSFPADKGADGKRVFIPLPSGLGGAQGAK